jgi:hypothetical protein
MQGKVALLPLPLFAGEGWGGGASTVQTGLSPDGLDRVDY